MGHHISAVLLRGPYDAEKARAFDLRPIPLESGITMFPLDGKHCDYWSEKLGVHGSLSRRPQLNEPVVHHMVNAIADDPLFAVIDTDFFGGIGDQAAAVYRGPKEVIAPWVGYRGPINHALHELGVIPRGALDLFDTVGLREHRDFDDLYEDYDDDAEPGVAPDGGGITAL
jgi:hypothetical protein